jgi:glycosyltransferase involved in cell wall biosynthesis
MKILQIIPELNKGGAERLVIDICQELQQREGIEVCMVVFRLNNAYKAFTEDLRIELIPSLVRPSLSGKNLVDIEQLQKFIDTFQPDVIHSHLFETDMVMSQLRIGNALRVMHFHDNMHQLENGSLKPLFSKKGITDFYERHLILKSWKKLPKKIAISIAHDSFTYAQKVLPTSTPVYKLLNGISINRFQAKAPKEKALELCMIGSLVEKKAQNQAISVVKNLHEKGLSFHLHLLGDGPKRKALEALKNELELTDFIHFHGNVDHPETFLHKAFVYLHTANYEPLGLVVLEAMAAGTPVVCVDGRGNRDLIEQGKNGFIFQQPDPAQLADQIIELWENAPLYNSVQQSALDFVKNFDITHYCSRLEELYRSHL